MTQEVGTTSISYSYIVGVFDAPSDVESKLKQYDNGDSEAHREHDRLNITVPIIDKDGHTCTVNLDVTYVEPTGQPSEYLIRGTRGNRDWRVFIVMDFAKGQGILELSA